MQLQNIKSFNFVANKQAKFLILGSMPSLKSLQQNAYYASPQNCFWWIMHQLIGDPNLTLEIGKNNSQSSLKKQFEQRYQIIKEHKIALWDVIGKCTRRGSLDAAIDLKNAQLNDFKCFFAAHKNITHIACNGGLAFRLFQQKVYQPLQLQQCYKQLPSTSPAHARLSREEKYKQWKLFLDKSRNIC